MVVDDEESIRLVLGKLFEKSGYAVGYAETGEKALEEASQRDASLIILDLNLPDSNGIEVFKEIRALGVDIPVIVITAQNTMKNAIEVMKLGAYDYIAKPFDLDEVRITVERAIENYANSKKLEILRTQLRAYSGTETSQRIVGKSPSMLKIYKTIGRIAEKDFSVLITGESGTGKELITKAIHNNSRRRGKPLVAVNIAAIPKDLLESELFGYEKGAFTGASVSKSGRFEEANTGTLHLDEIGEMPLELQTKLLRILEESSFYRLGAEKPIEVDIRLIASTNKDLEKAVHNGRFRRDLYYRINAIAIVVPPLRERKEDINLLIEHFTDKYSSELGEGERFLTDDAKMLLVSYDWPGNVRELENTIKRVLALSSDTTITNDILLDAAPYLTAHSKASTDESFDSVIKLTLKDFMTSDDQPPGQGVYERFIKRVEKPLIEEVLEITKGNKKKAALLLGINRNTLSKKIEELKALDVEHSRAEGEDK